MKEIFFTAKRKKNKDEEIRVKRRALRRTWILCGGNIVCFCGKKIMGRSMGRWVTLHGSTILSEDETDTFWEKKCEVEKGMIVGYQVMNVRKITCNVFEITWVSDCIGIFF